jgi:hypothetical protein
LKYNTYICQYSNKMLEKYYSYLYFVMGYTYGLIRKSKKKGFQIYRFENAIVVFLNDYSNRRLRVFFFKQSTKQLWMVSMHGFYVRKIRYKIVTIVKKIQEDDNYWDETLVKKRSYSYKQERAYTRYMNYKNK